MTKIIGKAAWDYVERYHYSDRSNAWLEIVLNDQDKMAQLTTSFDEDNYMGRGTILQRDISNMPIVDGSDEMAQSLVRFSPFAAGGAFGDATSLNTSAWGTQPVHAYVVESHHPDAVFQEWAVAATGNTPQVEIDTYLRGEVPQASWMIPAQNHDYGMAIYDKSTGIMREVFYAKKNASGVWTGSGGYSVNTPGLKNLARDNYALQQRRGIATVSGMHNSLGFVGIAEALNKKINHALCFTLAAAYSNPPGKPVGTEQIISWPARASDGKLEQFTVGGSRYNPNNPSHVHGPDFPKTITHGQWGRLKADVDPKYNPKTGLPYRPFTQILITAAKKYGLVATDTNHWCNAFNAEQGRTWKRIYGEDPWDRNGVIAQRYINPLTGAPDLRVDDFPWDRTEWAVLDWGRPSPDWNRVDANWGPWVREGATVPTVNAWEVR